MKMKTLIFVSFLALFLLFAGCTQPQAPGGPPATATPAATPPLPDLTPAPTDSVPPDQRVALEVSRGTLSFNPVIRVEYRGGPGMILLSDLEGRVTGSDGIVRSASLHEPKVGDAMEMLGTTGKDRLEVYSRLKNGNVYRIYDAVLEFRD